MQYAAGMSETLEFISSVDDPNADVESDKAPGIKINLVAPITYCKFILQSTKKMLRKCFWSFV